MLAKPSRGLCDPVPGTFPPSGPEDEAQDGGSHPRAPESEQAGEASSHPNGLPGRCLATRWAGGRSPGRGSYTEDSRSPGPGPKLEGEASPGLVDFQALAPQGMAGWKKGAPVPGSVGGPITPYYTGVMKITPDLVMRKEQGSVSHDINGKRVNKREKRPAQDSVENQDDNVENIDDEEMSETYAVQHFSSNVRTEEPPEMPDEFHGHIRSSKHPTT
ncbi:hypothetical protein NDU88_006950 [Pleurodeles waltl]|uniref:Uncharacterized protein n=1 Tax=Pleurodeles waltl TaxID=8319 RepID=A0AAV7UN84_PLEWA|nr:hypothetical protein NDU88_006950 [Pleurodeles waltl]